MMQDIGLVLVGGGARAAYQAGVIRGIYEILNQNQNLMNIISGNSAGAINASFLAANAFNWDLSTKALIELWNNISPDLVFDLRKKTISELGLKWISGATLGGLTQKGNYSNYLLETTPLRKLLEKHIKINQIEDNIKQNFLKGISLSATNYNTGNNVIFFEAIPSVIEWIRAYRIACRTTIDFNHVMASAAIPFFFPPIKVGDSYFGDGCIRQHTPLSPAIHLGANKIIAIGVRCYAGSILNKEFPAMTNPSIGQILGIVLNAIFMDSIEQDLERLEHINEIIKDGQHSEFRKIPTMLISPSRDLGNLSEEYNTKLPGILKYLLKGIGVSDHEGLDLRSYLSFDSSYTRLLLELGYEDALKIKKQILDFIG